MGGAEGLSSLIARLICGPLSSFAICLAVGLAAWSGFLYVARETTCSIHRETHDFNIYVETDRERRGFASLFPSTTPHQQSTMMAYITLEQPGGGGWQ